MAITGAQLVTDALLQATILGHDQQLPDAMAQLALRRFNRMKDSWANISDLIFATTTDTFTMTPALATYSTTLLANGRPAAIDSMWVIFSNISYPVTMRDEQWYNSITYKPTPAIPNNCYYNAGMPNGTFKFYPTPYAAFVCNVARLDAVVGAVTLTTNMTLPPGYEKALVDSLAVDIFPTFKGSKTPIPPDLKQLAIQAQMVLKNTNYRPLEMNSPFSGGSGAGSTNFFPFRSF
jgi:hypothetical protein